MCSGIRDAANLAWKLDLVPRDAAPASLLDTYTSERLGHVRHAIHMWVELGRVICVLDPDEAEGRNRRMVEGGAAPARVPPPAPPPVLAQGVVHRSDADVLAGTLCLRFRLGHRGESGELDEIVGPGFAVVTLGRDPREILDASALGFLEQLGAHLVPVVAPGADGPETYLDLNLDLDLGCRPCSPGRDRRRSWCAPTSTPAPTSTSTAASPRSRASGGGG